MTRAGYVYIMASGKNGTIYIGVTSDLSRRVWQHREGAIGGFTKKYGCKRLVWFELFENIHDARLFEARMKKWKRGWKIKRIEEHNADWNDLFDTLS